MGKIFILRVHNDLRARQAGQNGLSGSVARARESQGTVQRNAEMIRVRMSLAEA